MAGHKLGSRRCVAIISPDYVWVLVITTVWIAPSPIHDAGVHICGAKCVGFVEQGDYGEQDGSDVLCWVPSLAGQLAALWVVDGRMEDRDAQISVLVDVWVPYFCDESDGRRWVWIVVWELHECLQRKIRSDISLYFRIDFSSPNTFLDKKKNEFAWQGDGERKRKALSPSRDGEEGKQRTKRSLSVPRA